jgi:hypothetical protein
MKTRLMYLIANVLLMFALVAASYAHDHSGDVYWHIDPSVKSCSMIIDPALTQVQRISVFVPYVGLRESLSIGTETTSKVNLAQEKVLVTQGYAGVSFSIWMLNLAAEYNISNVNTLAFIVGFTF